eukprot:6124049-Pyramimonas_sp.AAC.2
MLLHGGRTPSCALRINLSCLAAFPTRPRAAACKLDGFRVGNGESNTSFYPLRAFIRNKSRQKRQSSSRTVQNTARVVRRATRARISVAKITASDQTDIVTGDSFTDVLIIGGTGRVGTAAAIHLLEVDNLQHPVRVILAGRNSEQGGAAVDEVTTVS